MAAAGGGGGAACAACKYQRRRCTAECPLAQYFPHDRPRLFRNAHRLFGVSNILKTLARAAPEHRRDAKRTIIFESNAWDVYPAHGCVAVIAHLNHQIRHLQLQLHQCNAAIQAYRDPSAAAQLPPPAPLMYGGDQQPPWMMQQPPQYDMIDMAHQPQLDHQLDATMMMSQSQPESYDEMSYFVDSIDEEMPQGSSTDSSSEKKAMKAPKMEDGSGFKDAAACFTALTSAVKTK